MVHVTNKYSIRLLLASLTFLFLMTACDDNSRSQGVGWHSNVPEGTMPPGFDTFVPRWNAKIEKWLSKESNSLEKEVGDLRNSYFHTQNLDEKNSIQGRLIAKTSQLEILRKRLVEGDYIQTKKTGDMPSGLVWKDGMEQPEIGDPKAKKGGSIRLWEAGSFPDTFRPIGPNSNNSFRGRLYDEIEMGLINLHPITGKVIPALADRWAIGPDGRTVYFHLDPNASYSDGVKVKPIDFLVCMHVRTSDYTKDVLYETVYKEEVSHITLYGDDVIAVTLPEARPLLPFYCSIFTPAPPHFYSEFGPNYVEKYQWRVPPTTGAYTISPEEMIRGRQITMKRVENWWARDKKFTKNTFNVDRIIYNFIADESKALELFRIGELDIMFMNKPELWHERMEIPEVHNGYIRRSTFFTIYPRPPFGIFLNTARPPFNDKNIRLGFHHALNIQKIIDINFRGDYQRLGSCASGYGRYTDSTIKAREFSPEKARKYFGQSGFTITCPDGILRKPDGTRLTAEITFPNGSGSLTTAMSQLKEDARKCGLDLQLDPLDSMVNFRKIMEKRHQACFMAWGFTPPHPTLSQCFHSAYAYDIKGNPIPYTNNISSFANPDMDRLLEAEKHVHTEDELEQNSHAIQHMIHNEALWVPGWTTEFARLGYWRWVQWPNSKTTQFCYPVIFEPTESHLYWVDESMQEETLKAKHKGIVFPEVDAVFDQYRYQTSLPETAGGESEHTLPSIPAVPEAIPATMTDPGPPQPVSSSPEKPQIH